MKSLLTPLLFLAFALLAASATYAETANTTVQIRTGQDQGLAQAQSKQITLNYASAVRTEQVLKDAQLQIAKHSLLTTPVYWLQAAIFTQPLEQEKSTLLALIAKKQSEFDQDDERYTALAALHQFISNSHFAKREPLELDYDQTRITSSANPLLSGELTLQLPARSEQVWVLGAVTEAGTVKWQQRLPTAKYLDQAKAISAAENDAAVVIQPDGKIQTHPIAYWNERHHDIAPGAIIYLPFTGGWLAPLDNLGFDASGFNEINQAVVSLLRERVL
ncbi:capsule biosynthesis GfcC family protein [Photobacterium sanguinicancri]|uniref:capsule biosynthesis GfcC family protein n=1 Tax=Photobacterium sanguinicancri TaxID=875932 RepID=UPI0026E26C5D|nr:capsule biosynthesis GfcC family protein [Photobacterium sanguinicancri]MDO6499514.1 capsule biosynthesis GfcC family protein [Photobacterium sanguinicancri]